MANISQDMLSLFRKSPVEQEEQTQTSVNVNDEFQESNPNINSKLEKKPKKKTNKGRPKKEIKRHTNSFSLLDVEVRKLKHIAKINRLSTSFCLSELINKAYDEHIKNGGTPYDQ